MKWISKRCSDNTELTANNSRIKANSYKVAFFKQLRSFILCSDIHIYIIGHYNPSVRLIELVSHTTCVVCFNFIHKWRDLQFKVDFERQIFWETAMAILFTVRVFARNLLRRNRRRNTFRILFWCLAWCSNPGFSSNKPTHYLLDHGDFDPTSNFFFSTSEW